MARSCPACRAAMQPLFLERDGAADVHLDRCAHCGGLWFDAGEAEAVSHRRLSWTGRAAAGAQRCPGCGDALMPGEVRAQVPGERCDRCHGLWLPEAAIAALGNARLEFLAARAVKREPPERPVTSVGFVCAKCARRAPWSDANGTASGLVCRDCTPRAVDDPAHGATLLTSTDRFVEHLLAAVDEDDDLLRGGRRRPLLANLLDWLLD